MLVQIAHDGHPDLLLMIAGRLEKSPASWAELVFHRAF